jgi:hypothetical protein
MRQDFGAEPFIPKGFAIVVAAEFQQQQQRLCHEKPDIPQENAAMPRARPGHSHGLE